MSRPIVKDEAFKKAREQVQLAAYFAKSFIEEVGRERALAAIGRAYENYWVDMMNRDFGKLPLDPKVRMEALAAWVRQGEKEWPGLTVMETTPTRVAVKVQRCPVFEVYASYGLGEVGQKWCDSDYLAAKCIHPQVRLVRDKEIAYGADYCNPTWVLEAT